MGIRDWVRVHSAACTTEAEQGEQRRSSSTVPAPCSNVVRAASAPMAARIGAAHLG